MNRHSRATSALGRLALVVTLAALGACTNSHHKKFTIGGMASGLAGAVVLQNNGGDNLTVAGDGSFTFAAKVKKGKTYSVTILSQPATQNCVIGNGSGKATANVTNVTLTCTAKASHTVGGTVSGLGTGKSVVLSNNGGDDLTVNAPGSFTFATPVISGGGYAVTVKTQPAGQTCVVTSGSGTVGNAAVTSVVVNCTDNPVMHSIGGTISGLTGTVTLRPSATGTNQAFSAAGAFTFTQQLASGTAYDVQVTGQPAGQTCTVTNGTGNVAADVTNVAVNCVTSTASYTVGGTITGLTGAGLRVENGAANAAVPASSATAFQLPNTFGDGQPYDVNISAQPSGQTCVITRSHGAIAAANVTNVLVTCIANSTNPIVGTYRVPALEAGKTSFVYLTFFADGVYIYGSVENNGTNCGTTAQIAGNGVEYGVYNYNSTSHAFSFKSAVVDTNGGCGVWDSVTTHASRYDGTLTITGSGQGTVLTLAPSGGGGSVDLVPVASTSGQIIGSWRNAYEKGFTAFLPAGGNNVYTFVATTQQDNAPTSTGQNAGIEYGCGATTALTAGTLTPDLTATCQAPAPSTDGPVDTNGTAGFSSVSGSVSFTVTGDALGMNGQFLRIKPN